MTLVEAQKPNLTSQEMEYAVRKLGRQPSDVEWAMLEVQWSEHCSYKSSKKILKQLPTTGKHVLVGPGYDAGVVDVGDGWVVTLHIESHNHPSAIDPYGGAATGVGGVVRDILSLGTRPIALLDPLRFGHLEKSAHSRWLLENVVRGISDYGNSIGVPTIGGEVEFDDSFERNCLVDVVSIGLGRKDEMVMAKAETPGHLVYLVGGSTGRDGIRGASFASRVLAEKSDSERSAVQVPDPFTKKLIIEAILEAVKTRIVRGMKDLGGGGITCALSEMASKGGLGIHLSLENVRTREPDMSPAEIMISESQERMALVISPEDEEKLLGILEKFDLSYARVGTVTADGKFKVTLGKRVISDSPTEFVAEAPLANHESRKPEHIEKFAHSEDPKEPERLDRVILDLLGSPAIASKEWIYRQYDHEVGIRTIVKPGEADSGLLRLPNGRSLAASIGGNSKHCYLDPYWGSAGATSEALCNLAVIGAEPLAVVDHLQFGDPNDPGVYWTFKEAVRGISDYLRAVIVPCVGGKVSFYNEDSNTGTAIKPSPVISAIGIVEKGAGTSRTAFTEADSAIVMVGATHPEMGGSEYYEQIHGLTGGKVPKVKVETEKRMLSWMTKIVTQSGRSAHDCSKGGLAIAISEMAIKSGKGFSVDLDLIPGTAKRLDHRLFSESHTRFVVEAEKTNSTRIVRSIKRAGGQATVIGHTTSMGELEFKQKNRSVIVDLSDASRVWSESIPKLMEAYA